MHVLEQLAAVGAVDPTDPAVLLRARAALVEATMGEERRVPDAVDTRPPRSNGTSSIDDAVTRHGARRLIGPMAAALVAIAVVAWQLTDVTGRPKVAHHAQVRPHPRIGAAAELRLIATNASEQSVPSLGADQLLLTESQMSILAQVSGGGSSTSSAQATVGLSLKKWSNSTGQSCTSITADPAQFSSAADHGAWNGMGLRDSPATQPVTGCSADNGGAGGVGATAPDSITGDGGVLNVSGLPVDPSALAQDLEAGTTGIAALDHLSQGPIQNIAFARVAVILIGPTTGASAAFGSALFRALSLIPGVTGLGKVTTHKGTAGQGFSYDSPNGDTTIIVDPATGTLLEARNIEDSASITTLAGEYLGPGPVQVRSYDATIQWIDPVGVASVVGVNSLPSDVPLDIFATVKPGVPQSQVFALGSRLLAMFGRPDGADSYVAAGAHGPDSASIVEYGFTGPSPQFHGYLDTVRSSGLFSSVDVI